MTKIERVCELGMRGVPPALIALALGCDGESVRALLSHGRKAGLDIPKHGTRPRNPVLPTSSEPVFANPVTAAWYDDEISALAARGEPQRHIARRFKVSLGYVQRALRRTAIKRAKGDAA